MLLDILGAIAAVITIVDFARECWRRWQIAQGTKKDQR